MKTWLRYTNWVLSFAVNVILIFSITYYNYSTNETAKIFIWTLKLTYRFFLRFFPISFFQKIVLTDPFVLRRFSFI